MDNELNMRVERHVLKSSNAYYKLLKSFCHASKNLYNFANFQIRKEYFKNKNIISYAKLDKMMKLKGFDFDYRAMPTSQTAQQCLMKLSYNWKGFCKSSKDFSKHPNKYKGRPRIPNYLEKDGEFELTMTNQNCKLDDGIIRFPRSFEGFVLKTKQEKFQQIRILPRFNHIVIEVVYRVDAATGFYDNGRYYSIDLGLDNLAVVTNNFGSKPFVISGKGLKSINQYYNKKTAHYRNISERVNGLKFTKRMHRITNKRNEKIRDFMHKSSRIIVNMALKNNVGTIVVGNNKRWKTNCNLGRKSNQSFINIPHKKLIDMLCYKCDNSGIIFKTTEESYTSGTSFLDNEIPCKDNYDDLRRVHRGLFRSNSGILINADVNGSYQILKKVFPDAYADGIVDVGLHPFKVEVV